MEVQPFREQICSITLFLALLVLVNGDLMNSANNGQKYIAKSYFDRYPTYIETKFSKFIANDVPYELPKGLPDRNYAFTTVSILHHSVVGDGSHRHLSSSMRLEMQRDFRSELVASSCLDIVIEKLPSGVFADPFELQHLVQKNVFVDAGVFGDTNLELPSFRSNQSVVEIHMSISSAMVASQEDDLEINVKVPLHARYQPLGLGLFKIEFREPDVLLRCDSEEKGIKKSYLLKPTNHGSGMKANEVSWEIPCGVKEHTEVVSTVTFISAVVAAFSVVIASICYSDGAVSNKLKHF